MGSHALNCTPQPAMRCHPFSRLQTTLSTFLLGSPPSFSISPPFSFLHDIKSFYATKHHSPIIAAENEHRRRLRTTKLSPTRRRSPPPRPRPPNQTEAGPTSCGIDLKKGLRQAHLEPFHSLTSSALHAPARLRTGEC